MPSRRHLKSPASTRFATSRCKLDGGSLTSGSGAVDHIAFRCDDYDRMIDRLRDHGLDYRSMDAPEIGLRLLFVNDPSGVTLELNFRDAG